MKRINLLIIVLCAMMVTMLSTSCKKVVDPLSHTSPVIVYNNMAQVSFITYYEVNVSHYMIQLSKDGAFWVDRGIVMAQDSSVHNYTVNVSTKDILITSPGKYYTRIKSIDLDGKIMLSPAIATITK